MNPRQSNILDPSYGQGGFARLRANAAWVHAIKAVPGGAFCCGASTPKRYTCFRLTDQGELDPTWGAEGAYDGQFIPGHRAVGTGLLPLADGKLLMLALHTERYGSRRKDIPALVRFNERGRPDNTFGDSGHMILHGLHTGDAGAAQARMALIAGQDRRPRESGGERIYLVINYPVGTGIVVRINVDGSLDTTFNGTGIKYMTSPSGAPIRASALLHDAGSDRLLICGEILEGVSRPCVMRLTADGQEDLSFGDGGYAVIRDIEGRFNGLALRDGHEIICVGSTGHSQQLAMVHGFDETGADLPGFFPGSTDFAGVGGWWSHVAIDSASNALVTLGLYASPDADVVVGRFLADGRIDSGFAGGQGWANVPMANGVEIEGGLALQEDGNALVGGVDVGSGDVDSRGFVLRCLTGRP